MLLDLNHGHLHTPVHVKLTNLQQYLHFCGRHPSSTKCFIPFSLAIWGQQICNYPEDLHTYTINLTEFFPTRGYPNPNNTTNLPCPLFSCHQVPLTHPLPQLQPSHYNYYPGLPKLKCILR
jgi:hypothetical protein